MNRFLSIGAGTLALALMATVASRRAAAAVTIENKELRLVIGDDGRALSLLHKPTGEECLAPGARMPAFAAVRHRGYVQPKVTPAHSVRREGDRLIVTFEPLVSVVTLRLRITDDYIGVTLEKIEGNGAYDQGGAWYSELNEDTLPFDELRFLQLPLKERGQFGAWLNVDFDRHVAVNLLATDPCAKIDSVENPAGRVMRATMVPDVRTAPVGAALIVSAPGKLLQHIDRLEADYGLPRGVRSRESEMAKRSYLEIGEPVTLQNVDRYIDYAHRGGFRLVMIVHGAFAKSPGHFPFRDEYPNGMADLRAVVKK
ncbi:MAG TPA: hypothetical protein VG710_06950, partial [Opitutus sp.]|nr:hypothetical protein [Opitutus sp.]